MIDDGEHAFQDPMAAVSDRVSSKRFANNGETMILTR